MQKKVLFSGIIMLLIGINFLLPIQCVCGSPSGTTIVTDKSDYTQGDTVYLTLRATGDVDHFLIIAKEGSQTSMDYLYDDSISATLVGGSSYEGTCSFKLTHGDVYVYITAIAFDSTSHPGTEGEITIYSEQSLSLPNQDNNDDISGDFSSLPPNFTFLTIMVLFFIALITVIIIVFTVIYLKKRKQKK